MIAYCLNARNVASSVSTDYKPHISTEGESDTMNCQDAITWLHRKGTRQPMNSGASSIITLAIVLWKA
ncbi:MAG: hypothetical protein NC453_06630 [Muribaculum sp.]|nr:hypothetical protein [Muribaculum sp.]